MKAPIYFKVCSKIRGSGLSWFVWRLMLGEEELNEEAWPFFSSVG